MKKTVYNLKVERESKKTHTVGNLQLWNLGTWTSPTHQQNTRDRRKHLRHWKNDMWNGYFCPKTRPLKNAMQFYDKIPGESMDTNVYLSIKKTL